MGHMYASNLARTTYQAPGHDKDTTTLRHNENANMAVINLHTSVAGAAKVDTVLQLSPVEANLFDSEQPLKDAKTAYSQAENQVCTASWGENIYRPCGQGSVLLRILLSSCTHMPQTCIA